MALTKPTSAGLASLRNKLADLQSRQDKMSRIGNLKDFSEWKAYRAVLEDMIAMHEKSVLSLAQYGGHLSDEERCKGLNANQQIVEDLRLAIRLGERDEEDAKTMKEGITAIERQLANKRDEMDEFGL